MGVSSSTKKFGQDQNGTLADHVFLNDLILRNIFKYLESAELIACRLVHPLWQEEATKILKKNRLLQEITIVCPDNLHVTVKILDKSNYENVHWQIPRDLKKEKLKHFLKLAEGSRLFPWVKFALTTNHWENCKIQEFFQNFGGEVKDLCVTQKGKQQLTPHNMIIFQKLLVTHLPNLHTLHLGKMPHFVDYEMISSTGTPQLESLKVLSLNNSFDQLKLLNWVLKEAPNLTAIRNPEGKFTQAALSFLLKQVGNKGGLIKDLRFEFTGALEVLDLFKLLAGQKPQLEIIHEVRCDSLKVNILLQMMDVINSLLQSSSESLKSLSCTSPLGSFPGLILPPLSNLEHVSLTYYRSHYKLFPKMEMGQDISCLLPRLRSVTLDFTKDVFLLEPQDVFAGSLTPFLRVTELRFSTNYTVSDVPQNWLIYLRQLFPHTVELTLPKIFVTNFAGAAQTIWRYMFRGLKKLHVRICVDSVDSYLEVDAGFTGFTKETCADLYDPLWAGRLHFVSFPGMEDLRCNPSILELENLQKLEIEFVCEKYGRPMTEVSRRFAFELMPHLDVSIVVNKQQRQVVTVTL